MRHNIGMPKYGPFDDLWPNGIKSVGTKTKQTALKSLSIDDISTRNPFQPLEDGEQLSRPVLPSIYAAVAGSPPKQSNAGIATPLKPKSTAPEGSLTTLKKYTLPPYIVYDTKIINNVKGKLTGGRTAYKSSYIRYQTTNI